MNCLGGSGFSGPLKFIMMGEKQMQDEILQKYEIRKSNKQKTAFIEYLTKRLEAAGYGAQDIAVEEKGHGLMKSRNIVVGNPAEAKVLFGGHYDTCAWMPFPNLMAPTNPVLFWGYQILLTVMIFVSAALVGFLAGLLCGKNGAVAYFVFLIALIALMIQLMVGFHNKHTANDNTSGIITLTQLLENLPEEQRKKVCVIYFDNEEKGLLGSSFFYKKHKKHIKEKMLINLDCVGDGNNIVTMADRKCRKDEKYRLFTESLSLEEKNFDVNYLCRKMKFMMFPSDQMNFKKGIGVCSLKKSLIGYYVARIHTYFDTKCRKENVEYLVKDMCGFVEKL